MFQNRKSKRALLFVLLCVVLFFSACKQGGGESPTPTGTPTLTPVPEGWWARLIQKDRTDVSRDMAGSLEEEAYFARPVSACKTVCLGDFEFSMTTPKTIYRLTELQDGTDSIQVTLSLRYAGEKESVVISAREDPFKGLMVTDSNQNWEGGGAYDVEMKHTLKKGEEISFTKVYEEYSRNTTAAGYGMIAGIVDFAVLDEEGKRTDETYEYLLSIPYDVLE